MNAQLEVIEPRAEVVALPPAALSLRDVFDRALQNGNPDIIGRMFDLYEKWEANQARKAFDAAVSAAKAEMRGVAIVKNRQVDYASTKSERGGRVQYKYEDLAAVLAVVEPILGNHGLSIGYGTEVDGNIVKVTCILKHKDGHRERNTLPGPVDNSGNKNAIQAMGSTVTYLQRYTLKAALGIAASEDDDGRSATADLDTVTGDQLTRLRAAIVRVGIDIAKVLVFAKVDRLEEIPARQFEHVLGAVGRWKPKAPPVPEDMSDMPDLPANLDRRGQPAPTVIPNARASR